MWWRNHGDDYACIDSLVRPMSVMLLVAGEVQCQCLNERLMFVAELVKAGAWCTLLAKQFD